MKRFIVYLMVIALIFTSVPGLKTEAGYEPVMQVKLVNYLGNKTEISLKPSGNYAVSDGNISLKSDVLYTLKSENGKIVLYEDKRRLKEFESFEVKPASAENTLAINNRPYLGSFHFVMENKIYIRPINVISMENYVKGVVPNEMPATWNGEALKVQAVAARTYAMSYIHKVIDDTINYQVYGGKNWHPNSTKAVDETAGEVLKYKGKLISAVFSASNGGKTESNANAWGNTFVPYFRIKEDPFDPKMTWSASFNKKQIDLEGKDLVKSDTWWSSAKELDTVIASNIKKWLQQNGFANKEIKIVNIPQLSLHAPTSGGRVSKGSITVEFLVKDLRDSEGKLAVQTLQFTNTSASKIRAIIGNRVILSYLVDRVSNTGSTIRLQGCGDGHGVGMSQYGAKKAAELGKKYKDILAFYYEGTSLVKEYENYVNFKDVTDTHWAETYINNLYQNNIVSGYSDRTFRPNHTLTRAQFTKILINAMGYELVFNHQSFPDVPKADWANPYIEAAVQNGLLLKEEVGTHFHSNVPITREEMAVMIGRALELSSVSRPEKFTDYYQMKRPGLVEAVSDAGILDGYPDRTFKPENSLTRAQAAKVIYLAIEKKQSIVE
ncbi:SpoIID/LytB domain-containing protein [Priestia abyssalis]|uniref:SpoIID/LytB domain-containing protein n=1 Tax=Priestia abyssalis TaxID=1221450 RepID=UPI00099580B9|nr:SpoIID/LytB domain-containing protein [Priestia abyssalis]